MNALTQEDIKNILALISRADIKGGEATAVAILQQKLGGMVTTSQVSATPEVEQNTNKDGTEYSLDA